MMTRRRPPPPRPLSKPGTLRYAVRVGSGIRSVVSGTDLRGDGLVADSLEPGCGWSGTCSGNKTLFLLALFKCAGCVSLWTLGAPRPGAAAAAVAVAVARRGDGSGCGGESRLRAGEVDDAAAVEADAVVFGRDERLGI